MISFASFSESGGEDDLENPPQHVIDWCQNLVNMLADGAIWGIPRSQIVFRVDKSARKLILTIGETSDPDFIATQKVFKHIGWTVVGKE